MEISPKYEEAIADITRGKLHFKKEGVGGEVDRNGSADRSVT